MLTIDVIELIKKNRIAYLKHIDKVKSTYASLDFTFGNPSLIEICKSLFKSNS